MTKKQRQGYNFHGAKAKLMLANMKAIRKANRDKAAQKKDDEGNSKTS